MIFQTSIPLYSPIQKDSLCLTAADKEKAIRLRGFYNSQNWNWHLIVILCFIVPRLQSFLLYKKGWEVLDRGGSPIPPAVSTNTCLEVSMSALRLLEKTQTPSEALIPLLEKGTLDGATSVLASLWSQMNGSWEKKVKRKCNWDKIGVSYM